MTSAAARNFSAAVTAPALFLSAAGGSGVRSAVRPEGEILSPRIWTTFATGVPAEAHGVEGWVKRGSRGGLRLYSNLDRTAPALWNIASAAGRPVAVLNWLMTQPPDRVDGVMIMDTNQLRKAMEAIKNPPTEQTEQTEDIDQMRKDIKAKGGNLPPGKASRNPVALQTVLDTLEG